MMENLWKLDFEPIIIKPEDIVMQQCKHLEVLTGGMVTANVNKHDNNGPMKLFIEFFTKAAKHLAVDAVSPELSAKSLGHMGDAEIYCAFEFYITSPSTPNYKFGIMNFIYAKGQYPVKLILDEDIVAEIGGRYIIECNSENNFISLLEKIITSKKVTSVVNALKAISIETA